MGDEYLWELIDDRPDRDRYEAHLNGCIMQVYYDETPNDCYRWAWRVADRGRETHGTAETFTDATSEAEVIARHGWRTETTD